MVIAKCAYQCLCINGDNSMNIAMYTNIPTYIFVLCV